MRIKLTRFTCDAFQGGRGAANDASHALDVSRLLCFSRIERHTKAESVYFVYSLFFEHRCSHEKPFYEHFPQCRQPCRRVGKDSGNGGHEAGSGKNRQASNNRVDERAAAARCGATQEEKITEIVARPKRSGSGCRDQTAMRVTTLRGFFLRSDAPPSYKPRRAVC